MKPGKIKLIGIVFIAVMLVHGLSHADEYDVNDVAGLNSAMNSAENTVGIGDTINIAAGIYSITSTIFINDPSEASLALIGEGPGVTILDGNGTNQILRIDTSGGAGPTSLIHIKDMTFRNGNAAAGSGGGVYVKTNGAELLVDNVEFLNNVSAGSGGGLFFDTVAGNSTVKNSLFDSNTAVTNGGGLYEETNNSLLFKLEDNTFVDNSSNANGGAAVVSGNGIEVERNVFTNNSCPGGNRGGLWVGSMSGSVQVRNSLFEGNTTTGGIGGLDVSQFSNPGEVYVINNSFYGNSASGSPAGANIFVGVDLTTVNVFNNIFYNNMASSSPSDLFVANDDDFNNIGSAVNILYNNFSAAAVFDTNDGNVTISNNLNTDPQFVDAPNSNFQLSSTSPVIDAGDNTAMSETVDLVGNPRFVDDPLTADTGNSPGSTPAIDMGAFEFQAPPSGGGGGGGGGGGCNTAGPTPGEPIWPEMMWIAMIGGILVLWRRRESQ